MDDRAPQKAVDIPRLAKSLLLKEEHGPKSHYMLLLMTQGQLTWCGPSSGVGMFTVGLKGQYKIYLKKGDISQHGFSNCFQATQLYLSRFYGPVPSSQLCPDMATLCNWFRHHSLTSTLHEVTVWVWVMWARHISIVGNRVKNAYYITQ